MHATTVVTGRFGDASPISGAAYSSRYWKRGIFDALAVVRAACDAAGVPMAAAALRWVMHHSVLSAAHGDGLILGASSFAHLEANLAACGDGPLPPPLVAAFDEAWAVARPTSTSYFRGYGAAIGSSDTFLRKHQVTVPASAV